MLFKMFMKKNEVKTEKCFLKYSFVNNAILLAMETTPIKLHYTVAWLKEHMVSLVNYDLGEKHGRR